jgi:hypothetical protein
MSERKAQSREYRSAIKDAWLPVVGRNRLTSAEYALISEWLDGEVALSLILRAIRQCAERARAKGITLVSLGVIRADLVALQRKQAATRVGAHDAKKHAQWRDTWASDMPLLIEEYEFTGNKDAIAMLKRLQADLPTLAEDQARARLREFNQKFK